MTEVQQVIKFIRDEEKKFAREAEKFKGAGNVEARQRMLAAASALGETARRIEKGLHHTADSGEYECPGENHHSENDRDLSWED